MNRFFIFAVMCLLIIDYKVIKNQNQDNALVGQVPGGDDISSDTLPGRRYMVK
jgi:hypothetical protein